MHSWSLLLLAFKEFFYSFKVIFLFGWAEAGKLALTYVKEQGLNNNSEVSSSSSDATAKVPITSVPSTPNQVINLLFCNLYFL